MRKKNISRERLKVVKGLRKEGDRIEFPMTLYNKLTKAVNEENNRARLRGLVELNEQLYSIRKIDDKRFYVIRIN